MAPSPPGTAPPADAAPPDVLVVGAPGVGKATLLQQGLGASQCLGKAPGLFRLHLHTKYYEADLLVQCHAAVSTAAATAGQPAPDLDQVQALVLVVDAGSSSSWECAMRFHESLQDREFDIQLLVANKMDSLLLQGQQAGDTTSTSSSASTRPAWLQAARDWCYAHSFEYIEAAAGRPELDATLHEDGEQQGAARVLAALQAHLWPSMQQLPSTLRTAGQRAAAPSTTSSAPAAGQRDQGLAAAAADAPAEGAVSSSQLQDSEQAQRQHGQPAGALDAAPTSMQPPASTAGAQAAAAPADAAAQHEPASAAAAAGRKAQQQQEQEQRRQQQGPAAEPTGAAAAVAAVAAAGLDDDTLLDADMDDFEQLMRQVMGARARLSALPDDARRAAAADLALKLSMMMGLGDDSDSGSEDVTAADDRQP